MTTLSSTLDKAAVDNLLILKTELGQIDNRIVKYKDIFRVCASASFVFSPPLVVSLIYLFRSSLPMSEFLESYVMIIFALISIGTLFGSIYSKIKEKRQKKFKKEKTSLFHNLVNTFYQESNMTALFQFFHDRKDVYQSLFTKGTIQEHMEEMFAASKQNNFEHKEQCLFKLLNLVARENDYNHETHNSKDFKEKFQFSSPVNQKPIVSTVDIAPKTIETAPLYAYMK